MRGPPDTRDIGSCRCVAQRRENGWGLIGEAPNHLSPCRRPSEIFAKLIEHGAVEGGAGRDSPVLVRWGGPRLWGGGRRPRAGFGGARCGGGPAPPPSNCGRPCPPQGTCRGPLASPRRSSR